MRSLSDIIHSNQNVAGFRSTTPNMLKRTGEVLTDGELILLTQMRGLIGYDGRLTKAAEKAATEALATASADTVDSVAFGQLEARVQQGHEDEV